MTKFCRWFMYPGPLWKVYSLVCIPLVILMVLIWGSMTVVVTVLRCPKSWQTFWVRSWNVNVLRLYRIRLERSGEEHLLPQEVSCLLCSNHQSLLDIPMVFATVGGHLRMVAKKELFGIPVFGAALRASGFIPIDRGNRVSGQLAGSRIRESLSLGTRIWVAPEGTRSADGTLLTFKKGSFAAAIEAQVPVQPLVLNGVWKLCPKGSWLVRPGLSVRVHVLPAVPTKGLSVEARAELANSVREMMLPLVDAKHNQLPT